MEGLVQHLMKLGLEGLVQHLMKLGLEWKGWCSIL